MTDRSLDDVLDRLRFAMVATPDSGGTWRSRPLTMAGQEGDRISFLISATAGWADAVMAETVPTTVTFSDPDANTYVSLRGMASASNDRARIADLWNVGAAAWFEGEDDPTVRVLDVTVEHGEFWDGPSGTLGQLVQMAGAAIGHEMGDQGDVTT